LSSTAAAATARQKWRRQLVRGSSFPANPAMAAPALPELPRPRPNAAPSRSWMVMLEAEVRALRETIARLH